MYATSPIMSRVGMIKVTALNAGGSEPKALKSRVGVPSRGQRPSGGGDTNVRPAAFG